MTVIPADLPQFVAVSRAQFELLSGVFRDDALNTGIPMAERLASRSPMQFVPIGWTALAHDINDSTSTLSYRVTPAEGGAAEFNVSYRPAS